jgi:hypothetical protein
MVFIPRLAFAVAVIIGVVYWRQYTIPVIGWISFFMSSVTWLAIALRPRPHQKPLYDSVYPEDWEVEKKSPK